MSQNPKDLAESNAEFLARMKRIFIHTPHILMPPDRERLTALAEERVMIQEYRLFVRYHGAQAYWTVTDQNRTVELSADLSTAIRSVAKIGGCNGN